MTVDFLDQLAVYLAGRGFGETNEANGTVNIFVNKLPADPDNVISIYGQPGTHPPHSEIPELMFPRFQLIVRNTDHNTGSTILRSIRAELHGKLALSLPNFYVLIISADQEGFPIGEDDKGRSEFSIYFTSEIRYGDSI